MCPQLNTELLISICLEVAEIDNKPPAGASVSMIFQRQLLIQNYVSLIKKLEFA